MDVDGVVDFFDFVFLLVGECVVGVMDDFECVGDVGGVGWG